MNFYERKEIELKENLRAEDLGNGLYLIYHFTYSYVHDRDAWVFWGPLISKRKKEQSIKEELIKNYSYIQEIINRMNVVPQLHGI